MPKNPLFPRAMNALQKAALSEFRTTALGQLSSSMRAASRSGNANEIGRLQQQLRGLARGGLQREIQGTNTYRAMAEVQRYAKAGLTNTVMDKLFEALGPVGDLMQALLRPRGRQMVDLQRELETAANMLEQFGYSVTRPGQSRAGAPAVGRTPGAVTSPQQGITPLIVGPDAARKALESLGFSTAPPAPDQSIPAQIGLPPPKERRRDIREGVFRREPGTDDRWTAHVGGDRVTVSRNDPMITGEMISVRSSNVHSIGYIWNAKSPQSGTLKVRFLDKRSGGPKSGAGATYFYYDVPPKMFAAFRDAASKGKWVWDHLRIRGTVSGHQKRYALMGLASDGYVPRKATKLGDEEWFIRRTVTGQDGKQYRSKLGDQMVRQLRPGNGRAGRPSNGRG